ncbi:MAG: hypothetical protein OEY14_01780, partial [Myxococcales bacterium]|nr:hypothetical protein [Myxococcales bacterium]
VSAGWTTLWLLGHPLAEANVETLTGTVPLPDDQTHWRILTLFNVGAAYDVTDYLNLAFTYSTFGSSLDSDATRENPIWNENTSISLTGTVAIDQFFQPSGTSGTSAPQGGGMRQM